MSIDLTITIVIIAIGIFLFVRDYFSIDTTSIIIMALFIVAGVLSPEEGFAGFNHPATLTLGCMFVVSAAVFNSGLLDGLSTRIIKLARIHYMVALITFCLIAGLFSAFVNDSAVVALLLPIALKVCRETKISPGMLLMPISFAALFGGTCTVIGTSTNILVSSYALKYGLPAFGMFEFSLAALCLMAIGFLYLFVVAPILLPRGKVLQDTLTREAERYIAEVVVQEDCQDIGKAVSKSKLVNAYNIQILTLTRNGNRIYAIGPDTIIERNDIIRAVLPPDILNNLRNIKGYTIKGDKKVGKADMETDERHIYEVIIPFGSAFHQQSLKSLNFRRIYNSTVIALRHKEDLLLTKFSEARLKEGDMLLILGTVAEIQQLADEKRIVILSEYKQEKANYKKAIPALLIALGVVLLATFNITSILISSMMGALLMVVLSILKPAEAYKAVEWKVIFMMAGVLSMGAALEKTGGADKIALLINDTLGSYDAHITLSILYLVTFLSTNVLSSKATAALMSPIVISLAATMGVSDRPFLIAVMFACSLTFMTPVSYPTNTMVYAPGNYKFNDFLKVGTPLNIITWIAASLIIPYFFPF